MEEVEQINADDAVSGVVENVRDLHKRAKEAAANFELPEAKRFIVACGIFEEAVAASASCTDECVFDLFFDYACFLESNKKIGVAEGYFGRALSLCRDLDKGAPFAYDDCLASVLCKLGGIHFVMGEYASAEKEYSEALTVCFRLEKKDPEEYEGKGAYVLNKLAGVHHKSGEDEEADCEYVWARSVYDPLAAGKPEKFGGLLAWNLKDLAYLHKDMGLIEAAKKELKDAWDIIKDLDKRYPGRFRLDVAKMQWSLAAFHRDINDKNTAVKEYLSSFEAFKDLPDDHALEEAKVLYELGTLYEELGSLDEAKKVFKTARKICDEIVRKNDDRKDEALTLLEMINGKDLNAHVNIWGLLFNIVLVVILGVCVFHAVRAVRNYFDTPRPARSSYTEKPKENENGFEGLFQGDDEDDAKNKNKGGENKNKQTGVKGSDDSYFYNLGLEKYNQRDYPNALGYFTDAAILGNASAAYYVGLMHEKGYGTKVDYFQAEGWYETAVKLNNKNAAKKLEELRNSVEYLYRSGIKYYKEENYEKALYYFQKAADKNESNAMVYLGLMHVYGYGVPKDYLKAAEWYEKAIKLGNATATDNQAKLKENPEYLFSLGLRRYQTCNYAWAVDSFLKAAAKGNSEAMYYLGLIYERGYTGEINLTKAEEWFAKAVALGNANAKKRQAEKENGGKLIDRKTETVEGKGQEEEKKNNLNGQTPEEMVETGIKKYENGEYSEARQLFLNAANLNNSEAMCYLGSMYEKYYKDYESAVKWFKKASELNNDRAMFCMGHMYRYGSVCAKDIGSAIKWYEKAGNLGNILAMNALGDIYYYGEGVPKNYTKAREWFTKSANAGDAYGKSRLRVMDIRDY